MIAQTTIDDVKARHALDEIRMLSAEVPSRGTLELLVAIPKGAPWNGFLQQIREDASHADEPRYAPRAAEYLVGQCTRFAQLVTAVEEKQADETVRLVERVTPLDTATLIREFPGCAGSITVQLRALAGSLIQFQAKKV